MPKVWIIWGSLDSRYNKIVLILYTKIGMQMTIYILETLMTNAILIKEHFQSYTRLVFSYQVFWQSFINRYISINIENIMTITLTIHNLEEIRKTHFETLGILNFYALSLKFWRANDNDILVTNILFYGLLLMKIL